VDLFELAALLKEFGCSEALNLDGGGSSTLVVDDAVANRPSDLTGPRPVANGLFVVYSGIGDWNRRRGTGGRAP
jgi:exopolysaccharide biosynthesis protein